MTQADLRELNGDGYFKGLENIRFGDALPAPLTSINATMPAGILGAISPAVVENILALRTGDEALGGRNKVMDWADEKYFMPFVEKAGNTSPYADNSTPLQASMNVSFNDTGHYRFSSSFTYGDLQAQQFSKARINYADTILRSATEALAVELNRVAFNGYIDNAGNTMLVYGLLNNPNLDQYIEETKKFENMTWQEIMAFFAKAVTALLTKSGNNINGQSDIRVVVSASAFAQLQSKYTDLGVSVYKTLTDLYPKMRFVPAIELDKAVNGTSNAIYFIGESAVGGIDKTTDLGFSEIALMGNVVQLHNGYSQTISAGTCGALIYKPSFVVRYSGV